MRVLRASHRWVPNWASDSAPWRYFDPATDHNGQAKIALMPSLACQPIARGLRVAARHQFSPDGATPRQPICFDRFLQAQLLAQHSLGLSGLPNPA